MTRLQLNPKHLDELFVYSADTHNGEVRVTKMIYYEHATYRDVAGDKERMGGVDFVRHWGVFAQRNDGTWYLTGRNETAHIEHYLNERDTRWMRTWKEAHDQLIERLTTQTDYLGREHRRFVRLLEVARATPEPTR